jgi:alpha/beta superfamily hydrolase
MPRNPLALSYSAIAPPFAEYDFAMMRSFTMPICTLMAEDDGLLATPSELPRQENISHTTIRDTNHFFLRREDEVANLITEFILSLR